MRNEQHWLSSLLLICALLTQVVNVKAIDYPRFAGNENIYSSFWISPPPCPDPPVLSSIDVIHTNCGAQAGSITLNMQGNGNYTYNWSPNLSTTNSMPNLVAGFYRVTISNADVADCSIDTFVIVNNLDGPVASIASVSPTVCESSNGQAVLQPSNLDFLWDDMVTSDTRDNLTHRTYSVTATDPTTNCYSVLAVTVGESNPLTSGVTILEPATCNQSNGHASITVLGGTGDYTFTWGDSSVNTSIPPGYYGTQIVDNGNGCVDSVYFTMPNAISEGSLDLVSVDAASCSGGFDGEVLFDITEGFPFGEPSSVLIKDPSGTERTNGFLSAGSYWAFLLDEGGCVVDSIIFQMIENTSLLPVTNVIDQTCNVGGIITLNVTGGVPPYKYDWEDIPGTDNVKDRVGLVHGNYALTVTDDLGCQYVLGAINVGDACASEGCDNQVIVTDIVLNQASCENMNGNAKILINAAPEDYSWEWSTDDGVLIAPGNERQSLGLGSYTVTITDNFNSACFAIQSFPITNSDGPQASVVSTSPVLCNGSNGTALLTPDTYTYTWPDGSHLVERDDLDRGYYFVTVSDGSCENVLTVYIDKSSSLEAEAQINSMPTCGEDNGSVTIIVLNGSGSYSYDWGAGATNNGLQAGHHEVLITDLETGCDTLLPFVLNNNVGTASITINGEVFTSCAGASDGTVDFAVDYSSGFILPATIEIVNHVDSIVENGSLFVGVNCIVVRDGNGCIAGQECFYVKAPLAINVYTTVTPVTCDDLGSIALYVVGGEGGYTYDWGDLAGGDDPSNRVDLSSGVYGITITDGFGCQAGQDTINVPNICGCSVDAGSITADSTDICDQKPFMVISATPDGDMIVPAGYQIRYFLTNDVDIITQINTEPKFNLAGSGDFVIHPFVYDPTQYDIATISIGQTSIFDINLQLIQGGGLICASLDVVGAAIHVIKCTTCNLPQPTVETIDAHCGQADGALQLFYTQDTTGFTYEWSPNIGISAQASNLEAGIYYVTIREFGDEACSFSKTIVISNQDGPNVTIDSIAPTICAASNGFLRLGPTDLDYLWENGATSNERSTLTDTVYAIIATDTVSGCFSVLAVEIEQEDPLDASLEVISQPVCNLPNGKAKVIVDGGSGNYTYSWGNFEEKNDLMAGEYSVVVVDTDYGCFDVLSFEMENEERNLIAADSLFLETGNCDQPFSVCLDIPVSDIFGYSFVDNGVDYINGFMGCGEDTMIFYDASIFVSGIYSVSGTFGGIAHEGAINSPSAMLDSLQSWDPFSGWTLENDKLIATNIYGVYGDLLVLNSSTGTTSILVIEGQGVVQKTALSFGLGTHDVFIEETVTGCRDTLFAQIECVPCLPVYAGPDTIWGGVCGVDEGSLCLNILPMDMAHYSIKDNWVEYDGSLSSCSTTQTQLTLTQGGHTLVITNEETLCRDTLQILVYCVPPADFVIDTTIYENDHLEICLDNSILSGTPFFFQELCQVVGQPLVSYEMSYPSFCLDVGGLTYGRDTLCLEVCDAQDCAVTYIYIDVIPRVDTISTFVTLTGTQTLCVDTSLFVGNVMSVENLCPSASGNEIGVNILGSSGCVQLEGLAIGVDTLCLAVCDAFDNCDTTIVIAESDVPRPDTLDVELIIGLDSIICVDVSSLPGGVDIFSTICADSPGIAVFEVSSSSYCVQITAVDYGQDSLCLEFCDNQFCDTLIIAVDVIQDSTKVPVANDDQQIVVLNRSVDFYPLDNDLINGTVDTIYVQVPPIWGSVIVNDDNTFTYIPKNFQCNTKDSLIYVLKNKNGTDNAVVFFDIVCDEVRAVTALSPNNDGINDYFYIDDIDLYPNNEVFVYNRWGNVVFHRKGYSNLDPWNGLWDDANLPNGTYYYIIDLGALSKKIYRGYIQVRR